MTEENQIQPLTAAENLKKMEALQAQMLNLRTQYQSEKAQCKVLKDSIERVKELRTCLGDKKTTNKKHVDDLKKELAQLKSKQNTAAVVPSVTVIPEDEVADVPNAAARALDQAAIDALKEELKRIKETIRNATVEVIIPAKPKEGN